VKFAAMVVLCLLLTAAFAALGTWQVERRAWKLDLIARTDARVHAPAQAAPDPSAWPRIGKDAEYLHVTARGRLLNDRETLVHAATESGPGYWVLTPLRDERGITILVNRGFVPPDRADRRKRQAVQFEGPVTVTGLLRVTEPKGAFLRQNDPAAKRWYSRDVQAIAGAARLTPPVAPYFIDADATPNLGGFPVGGLTVVHFRNAHLQYAITWYALAALSLAGLFLLLRHDRREWRE
jgi:surfeit locus 1 family protein